MPDTPRRVCKSTQPYIIRSPIERVYTERKNCVNICGNKIMKMQKGRGEIYDYSLKQLSKIYNALGIISFMY